MKGKLNESLRACSYEAIGVYTYLANYCYRLNLHSIVSEDVLVIDFINSIKPAPYLDRVLIELEAVGLVIYGPYSIIIKELVPKEVRDHSLDDALGGVWLAWVEYKATEKKSAYKSAISERRAYDLLLREVNGDENLAAGALINAMAMGWHGSNTDVYLRRLNNTKNQSKNESNQSNKLGRIDRDQLTDWLKS